MSYIKLSQIADLILATPETVGTVYIEDENGNILVSENPVFPLLVTVEVISWASQEDQQKHGKIDAFNTETLVIPDQTISIRQHTFNQLEGKYPGLVI